MKNKVEKRMEKLWEKSGWKKGWTKKCVNAKGECKRVNAEGVEEKKGGWVCKRWGVQKMGV